MYIKGVKDNDQREYKKSARKCAEACRFYANAAEGDCVDLNHADRHINAQREAVEAFRTKFGHLTVWEYLERKNTRKFDFSRIESLKGE